MAGNPLISQGTLNRLRGSVVIPNYPQLNVTAPFLGKAGISLGLEGQSTVFIETMTGAVTSPEPYMMTNLTVNLLKSQSLSNLFKQQMEFESRIGDLTVIPDSSLLGNYPLINCAIEGVRELAFSGDDAGYVVTVRGYYLVNSNLWNLI